MKKRILHLVSNRWNSAISEYALSSMKAMTLLGHECSLLALNNSPIFLRARADGIKVSGIDKFGFHSIGKLKQVIDQFKPDVVISYAGVESFMFFLVRAKDVRHIRVRGYEVGQRQHYFSRFLGGLSYVGVDSVVVPSVSLAKTLQKYSSIDSKVVTLGIDTSRFQLKPRSSNPRPTLLIFGRLDPVKGHERLMEIFKIFLLEWKNDQRPRLVIAGKEANTSFFQLENKARELGLVIGEDIDFIKGHVEDVAGLMSSASLGVVSSLGSEVICRVAQEFLVCGTAVLVSGVGSLEDVLLRPHYGQSYRGLDLKASAWALNEVFETTRTENDQDRQLRREQAIRDFSLEAMAEQWRSVIDNLSKP
jgi:glycosyltransferase involved in cell wall biosynthesis